MILLGIISISVQKELRTYTNLSLSIMRDASKVMPFMETTINVESIIILLERTSFSATKHYFLLFIAAMTLSVIKLSV